MYSWEWGPPEEDHALIRWEEEMAMQHHLYMTNCRCPEDECDCMTLEQFKVDAMDSALNIDDAYDEEYA